MEIHVRNLVKCYQVHRRDPGLAGSLRSLFHRTVETVRAVDGISFGVGSGEIVGFLGPNGAGKTTTLKVLSGLLHPTSGDVEVGGYRPFARRSDFLKCITLVMGQKSQLMWDLPPRETFEVNRSVFQIPRDRYRAVLGELTELLGLESLLVKPTRKLSLGERMKCELAAALLHEPRVLFLDEPTIGLDITMQNRVREFLREYNRRTGATILLTSHYMGDVVALCRRILVIDHGRMVYDGALTSLAERVAPHKRIRLRSRSPLTDADLATGGEIHRVSDCEVVILVPREDASRAVSGLLQRLDIEDIAIEDPEAEEVIQAIFSGSAALKAAPSL